MIAGASVDYRVPHTASFVVTVGAAEQDPAAESTPEGGRVQIWRIDGTFFSPYPLLCSIGPSCDFA
jgi:hypothetical protein